MQIAKEPDLKKMQPAVLWRHFEALCKIPRCSGNEAGAADYVVSVARRHNLPYRRDALGNTVVDKPASAGVRNAPAMVLQSHLDMVCEKDTGVQHDFTREPLALALADGWLTAQGTTLGADNGVGIAAALAVLEDETLTHGPLQCLFTVDEERGLAGAQQLAPDFIDGHILLNLDGDRHGVLFVGCAGGGDTLVSLPVARKGEAADAIAVSITGLLGGHSGIEIDRGRGNALQILAYMLYRLSQEIPIGLIRIEGGNKANAIPREARALIALHGGSVEQAEEILSNHLTDVRDNYRETDPGLKLIVEKTNETGHPLSDESQRRTLGLLLGYPVGVIAHSREMPDLVETSNNLAIVRTALPGLHIQLSSRSSRSPALAQLRTRLKALSEAAGATVRQPEGYPGWRPELESSLLNLVSDVYEHTFGEPPQVRAVHAGVEPAVIGRQHPHLEMISIGPTIEYAHSPRERVSIDSVDRFWRLLLATLERLAASADDDFV